MVAFRQHLAAWLTAGFATLLLLLTFSEGPGPLSVVLALFVVALVFFGVSFATESAIHGRGRARQP